MKNPVHPSRLPLWAPALAAFLAFASCQSLQRDLLYSSGGDEGVLTELAEQIVPLDKERNPAAAGAARKRIAELEKSAVKDRNFEGRLEAWSGRLFLLEGKTREAAARLKKAENLYPGSVEGRVLLIRLEGDPEKRRKLCEEALAETRGGGFAFHAGEFNIELGRAELELREYQEAAAAFDAGFLRLPGVYRSTYGEARQSAWELRNLDPGASPSTARILLKNAITWEDAVELAGKETALLRFLSPGNSTNNEALFRLLAARSIIPPTQNIDTEEFTEGKPGTTALHDRVLRSGAAWYLWRLLAENRADRSILSRYSSRYPRWSPIPDLGRTSIFFDAVVGCVERELMNLPDGKNFNPQGSLGGAEFLRMLKKIEK